MKQTRLRLPWGVISLLALSIAFSLTLWACGSDDTSSITAPERGQVEAFTVEHPTMLGAIEP